ncbi:MAG TPA: SIR2 family protein [Pyrinomonadaceae bacterium]|nr:SIR2 family protein [Pyrinomonadaceae bacterium]
MAYTLTDNDWAGLLDRIQGGKCTPFLGAGVNYGILPTGATIAADWAREYEYPLKDVGDLARVAQFVAIKLDEPMRPKELILSLFEKTLKGLDLDAKLKDPQNPLAFLAGLPLPVYITTNYDDFMTRALKFAGKTPHSEICGWNPVVIQHNNSIPTKGKNRKARASPTKDDPLVFHLHGHQDLLQSLVLTEDDYLDFLVEASKQPKMLPPRIQEAVTNSSLLFIGYRLADVNFRVLFRGLLNSLTKGLRSISLAVQLPPEEVSENERANMQAYLDKYFRNVEVKVYWGEADRFLAELHERWERFNR